MNADTARYFVYVDHCAVCRKDICKDCIGESNGEFAICKGCSENYKLNPHWDDVMGVIDKRTDEEISLSVSLG